MNNKTEIQLEDLVGLHQLTGVDMNNQSIELSTEYFRDCQVINFILDGKTYTAIEDPSDGYRSCMHDIYQSNFKVSNVFQAIQVMGLKRIFSNDNKDNVLDFYDTKNGKLILSVGTKYSDDYYPSWEAVFTPENMSINS